MNQPHWQRLTNGSFPFSSWYGKWEEGEAGSTRAGAQNSRSSGAKMQSSLIYSHTFLCVLGRPSRVCDSPSVGLVLPGLCKPVTIAKSCLCLELVLSHWPNFVSFCWEAYLSSCGAVIITSTS